MLDHEAVLHDRPGDTDHVGFLEGISADHGARHLARQHDHWNRVHVRGGNAGDGVGRTWTRRHQNNTGLAGSTGITVSHMGGGLLVTHENVLHLGLFEQGVIHMQESTTWVPVNILNAFVTQKADDHFCA